jgi:hypothetical protein
MFLHSTIISMALLASFDRHTVAGTPLGTRSSIGTPLLPVGFEEFELIPGPGLPSLQSLNLTMAELLKKTLAELESAPVGDELEPARLRARSANCWGNNSPSQRFGRVAALVCVNFLTYLDTTPCPVVQAPQNTHLSYVRQVAPADPAYELRVVGAGTNSPA